jgi:hypothetical protein
MPKKKSAPKKTQQPIWTRSDVFFGDQFDGILGAVQLPTTTEPAAPARPAKAPSERAAHANYTVAQAAEILNLSQDKVRKMFQNEPDVERLTDTDAGKKRKRKYVTLRIPPEVFERVRRRMKVPNKG